MSRLVTNKLAVLFTLINGWILAVFLIIANQI